MKISISWNKADLEAKLLQEIRDGGMRVAAESTRTVENGNGGENEEVVFHWKTKPSLEVSITAEPDPDAVDPNEIVSPTAEEVAALTPADELPELGADIESQPSAMEQINATPLDPSLLPDGANVPAIMAIERNIQRQRQQRKG